MLLLWKLFDRQTGKPRGKRDGSLRIYLPAGLLFIATLIVVTSSSLIPVVCAQTELSANGDKVEYYFSTHDWEHLVRMGKPAIPRLIDALETSDGHDRSLLLIFLRSYLDDQNTILDYSPLIPVLVQIMNEGDSNCRSAAAEVLKRLKYWPDGEEARMRYLVACSADPSFFYYAHDGSGVTPSSFDENRDFWNRADRLFLLAMSKDLVNDHRM